MECPICRGSADVENAGLVTAFDCQACGSHKLAPEAEHLVARLPPGERTVISGALRRRHAAGEPWLIASQADLDCLHRN